MAAPQDHSFKIKWLRQKGGGPKTNLVVYGLMFGGTVPTVTVSPPAKHVGATQPSGVGNRLWIARFDILDPHRVYTVTVAQPVTPNDHSETVGTLTHSQAPHHVAPTIYAPADGELLSRVFDANGESDVIPSLKVSQHPENDTWTDADYVALWEPDLTFDDWGADYTVPNSVSGAGWTLRFYTVGSPADIHNITFPS